jgi:hypothetical protein
MPVTQQLDRFCALAESHSAAIRWRFSDYAQLLTKQLKLLAGPEFALPRTQDGDAEGGSESWDRSASRWPNA